MRARNNFEIYLCLSIAIFWLLLGNTLVAAIYYPNGSISGLIADINTANESTDDDIIDLGGNIYTFTTGINNPDGSASALPVITATTTLGSPSGKLAIINGTIQRAFSLGASAPFFRIIYNQGDLALNNITLENGYTTNHHGGAIYNEGNISRIINTVITNNTTFFNGDGSAPFGVFGGGIYNLGTIDTIIDSIIAGNTAINGGGIYNASTAVINMVANSTLVNNQANGIGGDPNATGPHLGFGGGIYNESTINNIKNSLIANNQNNVGAGGGIANFATITNIENTTIYGNIAMGYSFSLALLGGYGGGIDNESDATIANISNCSIIGNQANGGLGTGGGVNNSGTINSLASNIIAGNTGAASPDIINSGIISGEQYNLFSDPTGLTYNTTTDIVQADASLFFGPLQDNGGRSYTVELLPGSLAINNGINYSQTNYDQRGSPFYRVCAGVVDIGAYEVQQLCP